jgi:hypothetical protein
MATNNSANQSSTGLQSLTSAGVFNGRTVTGTANQISVSNGDGTGGNPTLSLTSTIQVTGISFDSGSNTLSNYSTGTFTPTITNTGSAASVSYSVQIGRYTRIGNRVIATVRMNLSAYTAGTGNTQMSALPITSNSASNSNTIGGVQLGSVTFGASVLYYNANLAPNSTSIDIEGIKSAAASLNLVAAGPGASSVFATTLEYEV